MFQGYIPGYLTSDKFGFRFCEQDASFYLFIFCNKTYLGVPVAQWVTCWPTDLTVTGSSPAHYVASDLGLHCLLMILLQVSR